MLLLWLALIVSGMNNTKHIHQVQVGDELSAHRNTAFAETFRVTSVAKMPNGVPYLIRGDGGKAIMTGNGDDSIVTLAD